MDGGLSTRRHSGAAVTVDLSVLARQMDGWAIYQWKCMWWGVRIVERWVHPTGFETAHRAQLP